MLLRQILFQFLIPNQLFGKHKILPVILLFNTYSLLSFRNIFNVDVGTMLVKSQGVYQLNVMPLIERILDGQIFIVHRSASALVET